MRAIVRATFPVRFTTHFEGATTWLYLDVLGIPTTAYGNALFSAAASAALPWRHADGSLATRDEIVAEYFAVQALKGQRNPRGVLWTQCGGGVFAGLTRLRLDDAGVTQLVLSTLDRNDADLRIRYGAAYEDWPACAQLGVLSLAWACGDRYSFPHMDACLALRDFEGASREIEMTKEHNPGNHLEARNEANRILMLNAARVQAYKLDPDLLEWTQLIGVSDAPTLPELPNPPSSPEPVLEDDGGASREQATFDAVDELAKDRGE